MNLNVPARALPRNRTQSTTDPGTDTDVGSDSIITYGTRRGDSSQRATSDAESRQDFQSSITLPLPPGFSTEEVANCPTGPSSPACSSPGAQTLATLKWEAIRERGQASKRTHTTVKDRGRPTPLRRIGRVMKKEYFESMPWTRTIVFGPMDPKWNPNKIYSQVCKCNVSMRSKGPREILRHYSTERHLRKDQRWTYEHLTIEDSMSPKKPRYQIRGKDGKVLTNYQLQLELPHFINTELVDIGE